MSLATTLEHLVRFRTISGELEEAEKALAWIEHELLNVPLHMRRHTHNGFPALVATTKRTKAPKLWLAAHVDVVHGGDHLFKPRIANGRMFGRGVFDMKFAIACYIELLKSLGDDAKQYDLGLMVTSDEEIGGFSGVKLLLEKNGYRGGLVFLPDGGGPWQFEQSAKGKMIVRVHTEGVAAHASRPWHGCNAIYELTSALDELRAYVQTSFTETHDNWYTTVVTTRMHAGEGDNMVPAIAEALLDIRTVRDNDAICLEKKFAQLEKKFPNTRFEVECAEPAYGLPKTNGYARLFARLAHAQYGITCGWTRSHGSSDGRFFAESRIPTLLVLPQAGGAHSEEEWVDLADLKRYYAVLRQFTDEAARVE